MKKFFLISLSVLTFNSAFAAPTSVKANTNSFMKPNPPIAENPIIPGQASMQSKSTTPVVTAVNPKSIGSGVIAQPKLKGYFYTVKKMGKNEADLSYVNDKIALLKAEQKLAVLEGKKVKTSANGKNGGSSSSSAVGEVLPEVMYIYNNGKGFNAMLLNNSGQQFVVHNGSVINNISVVSISQNSVKVKYHKKTMTLNYSN